VTDDASRHHISPHALFRYHVISEVTARVLAGMSDALAIRDVLLLPHVDPRGRSVRLAERTVYRWLRTYRSLGIEGLEDRARKKVRDSTVLSQELVRFLEQEKKRDPRASVPELIRRARELGHIGEQQPIDRTSVWRTCKRLGLPLTRPSRRRDQDMRRFAYSQRMLMVLADGKRFRAGTQRLRRVALCFIDDATRFALGGLVGTSESTEIFLRGFHRVILDFGMMRALFLDNGGAFISDDTRSVAGRLRFSLIFGTAEYPEGHGKIERWNRTLWDQLLRTFDNNPEIDPDLSALTLRLLHWVHHRYNHTPHEALKGKTPAERWAEDERDLAYPDRAWLDACFTLTFERRVSNDNVISFEGVLYELPRGHAGATINVTRDLLDPGVLSILHNERLVRIHPVDLESNAYARRARRRAASPPQPAVPPDTAAHLAFRNDFAPIVDPDGGYPKGVHDDSNDR